MKIKNICILITTVIVISSCSVDNDSEFTITKSDLVGTWSLTSFEMDDATLVVTNPTPTQTITADAIGSNYNGTLTISENPDIATVSGDFTLSLLYNQTSVDIYVLDAFVFTDVFGFSSSSWDFADNTLTLMENGENLEVDIIDFTGDFLKIEVDVNETVTVNSVTSNVTGKATVILEK